MDGVEVGIVGAGRVARALVRALVDAPTGDAPPRLAGLWARRKGAARALGAEPLDFDQVLTCDLVILAVRDDAIGPLSDRAARYELEPAQVFAHCSGALGVEAFARLRRREPRLAVFHPLRSLTGHGERPLEGARCVLHGDGEARGTLEGFARAIGVRAIWVPALESSAYHAAAALASNGITALLDVAARMLADASGGSLGMPEALELAASAARALDPGGPSPRPEDALTGPVARGEVDVVEEHLAALAGDPDLTVLYVAIMRRALDLARRAGLAPERAAAILATFDSAGDAAAGDPS